MTTEPNDGLLYLQMYPHLRKWINQCVACQQLGYNPQMLAELDRPIALKNLRRYFQAMPLDDAGHCEQCASAIGHSTVDGG